MIKRPLGWLALVAIAAVPFLAACKSTKSSGSNVQNMTTTCDEECMKACEKSGAACAKECAKQKATQNALVAPEKADCPKACDGAKKSSCPMSGGNEPQ